MSLTPGTRLGPYEITAPLGAGGMGEVFRATDTRLGRDVAVKVLPQHLSANPEVRARFEREAKTVSSLNHPHICTLFDIGREGDTDYLVMELVEGETLAERLAKGALPAAEVLKLGAQIADALDRAHRAGVIHRDLKPGNVMLTKSGAKLMDFGLARTTGMVGPAAGSGVAMATATHSPTMAAPLTAEGTILGTFQYMAPEQMEGSEADARSDLWALGCVLYEMATGRRAFEGRSQASLIASIMGGAPPSISQVVPLTPSGLERLVQACLAKDPADRLQSAHDIRMQLEWLAEGGSQVGVPAPVAARRRSRARLAWTLAAAGWLVAVAAVAWIALRAGRPESPFFSAIAASPSHRPLSLVVGPIALSPDGTRLATLVRGSGEGMVSVYDFRSGGASVLESTKGAGFPFWSPDGRWIGFFADGKLRKVDAGGGPAQPLADAFAGRGGTWSRTGVIVFAPDIRGPLMKVSENGGPVTAVTHPDSAEITHRNPYFLPDGKRFLFLERGSRSEAVGRLMAGSIDGATPREVLGQASNVQVSAGHLLFVRDRSLLAQRFDQSTLTLRGPIEPVAENIDYYNPRDIGNFSATLAGLLVFRRQAVAEGTLAWFDRNGRVIETLGPPEKVSDVVPSRDLRQLALIRRESSGQTLDIWVLDVATKQTRRVTFTNTPSNMDGAFSPDGERLAVSSANVGAAATQASGWASSALWIQPISGARSQETLLEKTDFGVSEWSPDGKVLLGQSQRTGTSHDITFVRLDDPEHRVHDLVNTRFTELGARFSPDGAWVVYESDESGRNEAYVVDFPSATRKWQVSRDGGDSPIWSQDGREIFFRSSGNVMAAPVTRLRDGIEIGPPTKLGLSEAPIAGPYGSDGKRFLVAQMDPATGSEPIQVVRNWSALLARQAR
ncbi:MAG: protein kinase domain-containing protein [Planctomycetota bacterium]|jgi:Tol biopolymer transport system component